MSPVTNKLRCHLSQTNQDVACHKQTKMSPVTNKPRCRLSQTNQDVACHKQTKMLPVTNKPRCHPSQTNQHVTRHKQTKMSPVTNKPRCHLSQTNQDVIKLETLEGMKNFSSLPPKTSVYERIFCIFFSYNHKSLSKISMNILRVSDQSGISLQ